MTSGTPPRLEWNAGEQAVRICGVWNLAVESQVLSRLQEILDEHRPGELRLDFQELEYLDSSAIAALIRLHGEQKAGGRTVSIHHAPPIIRTMLGLVRLDRLIPLRP